MEDLNKNQIVLLTLLVSFVTSIATGIITVSLLQEAPIEVTRNINRIVEKTIETVTTPATIISTPGQKEVTTVVVKEDDLIVESINKNLNSIARIKEDNAEGLSTFYGIGVVVNKEGFISADRKTITSGNTYTAVMSDGKELKLTPVGVDKQTDIILFKASLPTVGTTTENYTFVPATLAEGDPKLGQTIISLAGENNNTVSVGRVSLLDIKESGTGTSTTKYLASVETSFGVKDFTIGSPIFNLSGDLIGVKVTSLGTTSFTPIALIKKDIAELLASVKTE